ncbi:hypothetical protein AX16_005901 [Volvariella volvacea WC 439]|nr:hypothetical protein AX16_005901 [Volvariella volvacea WC 439]
MLRPLARSSMSLLRSAVAPSLFHRVPARFLSQEVRAQLDKAVKGSPVVLFMKGTPEQPQCGFSRAVVQLLDVHEVPPEKMTTYNVLEDPELRSAIKEYSDWPTIPQLYVNGEFIGGCDILMGMHKSGELETLLEQNNIIPPLPQESQASIESKPASA